MSTEKICKELTSTCKRVFDRNGLGVTPYWGALDKLPPADGGKSRCWLSKDGKVMLGDYPQDNEITQQEILSVMQWVEDFLRGDNDNPPPIVFAIGDTVYIERFGKAFRYRFTRAKNERLTGAVKSWLNSGLTISRWRQKQNGK